MAQKLISFGLLCLYGLVAIGYAVYLRRLRADIMNFNITRGYPGNPGYNSYCQRKGLSKFDLSVCFGSLEVEPNDEVSQTDDDKHTKLFLLYTDGTPFGYYKHWATQEKWAGKILTIPVHGIGPLSSGPVFRSSIIGRLDGDFLSDMSAVDNIFGQIYKVAEIKLGLHLNFLYPVWHCLQNHTFDRWLRAPTVQEETFNSFCNVSKGQGYIRAEYNDSYGCTDLWECAFQSLEDAADYSKRRKEENLQILHSGDTTELEECLDKEVGQTGGIFMFSAATDIHGHAYTMLSRKVAETHATMGANIEFTAEYLLKKYPDCLIAIFSDHGHGENIVLSEWTDHGEEHDDNRAFMLLLSSKFANKKLRAEPIIEDNTIVFMHIMGLLRGTNLPLLTEQIPSAKYQNDTVEMFRIYRMKEMQLENLFMDRRNPGRYHVDQFLIGKGVDTGQTVAQMAKRYQGEAGQTILEEYEAHLQDLIERYYKPRVGQLLGNWYARPGIEYVVLGLALFCTMVGWVLLNRVSELVSRSSIKVATAGLGAWYVLRCIFAYSLNAADIYLAPAFLVYLAYRLQGIEKKPLGKILSGDAHLFDALTPESKSFLKATSIILAIIPLIVRFCFTIVLQQVSMVKLWLYSLSYTGSNFGLAVVGIWAAILIYLAWKFRGDSDPTPDSLDEAVESTPNTTSDRYAWAKFKVISGYCFTGIQTVIVLNILRMVIKYEQKLFRQQSLEHGGEGVELVVQLYKSVGLGILCSFLGGSSSSQMMLLATMYVNSNFWLNHLSRITIGLFIMPVFVYLLLKLRNLDRAGTETARKALHVLFFGLLLVYQFAHYRANKEDYTVYVNQRALWRQPTLIPDDSGNFQEVHIFNIKSCTAMLLMIFMYASLAHKYLFEYHFVVFFHACFLMIECFFQFKANVNWTSFYPMVSIQLALPLLFLVLHWIRRAVQGLVGFLLLGLDWGFSVKIQAAKTAKAQLSNHPDDDGEGASLKAFQ